MFLVSPDANGGEPRYSEAESRLVVRASNVLMAGFVLGVIAGIAAFNWPAGSLRAVLAAAAAFLVVDVGARIVFWQLTRPLAHLAAGPNRHFDRIGKAGKLHLDLLALALLPLLVVEGYRAQWIVVGVAVPIVLNFLVGKIANRVLARLNARDAAINEAR